MIAITVHFVLICIKSIVVFRPTIVYNRGLYYRLNRKFLIAFFFFQ